MPRPGGEYGSSGEISGIEKPISPGRHPHCMKMNSMHRSHWLAALVAAFALIVSACGGSSPDLLAGAGDGDAPVDVAGVQQGCADLLDVGLLLTGGSDTLTKDDLAQMSDGIGRARASFGDAPDGARRYLELVDEALKQTVDEVADRGEVSSDQIALLLGVELLADGDELEQVSPEYNAYFESTCGASVAGGLDSSPVVAAPADTEDEADDGSSGQAAEELAAATATPEPPPAAFVDVDASSVGAQGSVLLIDIEVGEVWRTNVDPAVALVDGADAEGSIDEYVLVEIRLTSNGVRGSLDTSAFGWVDAGGLRTAADAMFDPTGADMRPRVDANESIRGYLVFPGAVGSAEGAVLQVISGDRTPENIPLAQGAAATPYPLALATGEAGSGTYNGGTAACVYPFESEIREAVVSLDGVDRGTVLRASNGKRFLELEIALDVLSVSGPSCDWATTVYFNLWEVRLRLDNGDVIAPYYFDGRAEVGATATANMTFSFPADVESIEFLNADGAVLATWDDLDLPDA